MGAAWASIAAWLLSLAWPLVKKVLVMLGLGIVTYGGLALLYTQVQTAVVSSWGAMGGSTLQLLTLGGFTQAVGIILSALSARVSAIAVGKVAKIAS